MCGDALSCSFRKLLRALDSMTAGVQEPSVRRQPCLECRIVVSFAPGANQFAPDAVPLVRRPMSKLSYTLVEERGRMKAARA